MHLSNSFCLSIKDKNIIPIIGGGTGCGKTTYIYNKLNKDLGIYLDEILVVCHLNAIKDKQIDISKYDFDDDIWETRDDDPSFYDFIKQFYKISKVVNLNKKNYRDNYDGKVNVTDYHSMEMFIQNSYLNHTIPNFKEKGIKCIVIDEAHELLMSSNYRSLQYLWHYLMKTDIYVVFLSATPEILLLENINTFNKKFELVYYSKSNIPISSIELYELKNTRRNIRKYNEIKKLISKNTKSKSFTIINDKKLIQKVVKTMGDDAIGMWSTSDKNSVYTDEMNNMRLSLIKKEKYLDNIDHMIATNAYGTGINIKDVNIDTCIIFYNSIEGIVQNISRLRLGVEKLIIVKDNISWIADSLTEIKEEFLKFKNKVNYYFNSGDCKSYFKIIKQRLYIQEKSNNETTFIILDNNYEPIINNNLEIVIDYLLEQIEHIPNADNIHEILSKYFKYLPEKEMSIEEKDKAVIDFIESSIKFNNNKAILFCKKNNLGYFSLEELKIEISKIYKKEFTTTSIRKLLAKLNYNLDKRKTSKTINKVKYVAYQLYKVDDKELDIICYDNVL